MPDTWRAWRVEEVRALFRYWRTGRPVCEWAHHALPGRTVGTIRVYANRWGLPPLPAIRRGQCLFSLLDDARGRESAR
jgi:hypothetical protein